MGRSVTPGFCKAKRIDAIDVALRVERNGTATAKAKAQERTKRVPGETGMGGRAVIGGRRRQRRSGKWLRQRLARMARARRLNAKPLVADGIDWALDNCYALGSQLLSDAELVIAAASSVARLAVVDH